MRKKNWKLFFPLLIGIYSAVGLVSVNISQMSFLDGIRSILAACFFSLGVYGLFVWRIHNEHKAAFMCAWFLITFFAYGHVYDAVEGWEAMGIVLGRHRYLFPLWVVITAFGMWMLYKSRLQLMTASRVLNYVSLVMLAIPVFQVGVYEWRRGQSLASDVTSTTSIPLQASSGNTLPDVYYIITDGYVRDDFLLNTYHLDNSAFISQMEALGFYIPRCSQSNYAITVLSLTSSLNMDYVDRIVPPEVLAKNNKAYFEDIIRHNRIRQSFEEMGYSIISFENGFNWIEWSDADVYFSSQPSPYSVIIDFREMTDFEFLYLRTTALRVVEEVSEKWLSSLHDAKIIPQSRRILSALENLETIPAMPGPKFIFLHLISPHEPFIFSPEGELVLTEEDIPGYPNQVQFLNSRLLPLMESLIAQSRIPPIIILQADHGRGNGRLANFTALYFPDEGRSALYPTISPVNLFRLVFNTYFSGQFDLLPDVSYYSNYEDYTNFIEVDYPCNENR